VRVAARAIAAFLFLLHAGPLPAAPRWRTTEVEFHFIPPGAARTVSLAGTFNDWNPASTPLAGPDSSGAWHVTLFLDPGPYQYKFVVDGDRWFEDPAVSEQAPDGFGGFNSTLHVDFHPRLKTPSAVRDGLIDRDLVWHDPNGPDQLLWATAENPALRFLFLRVSFKAEDVTSAGARVYRIDDRDFEAFKDFTLEPYARTGPIEYRAATLLFEDEPAADELHSRWRGYRFWLDDGEDLLWVANDTTSAKENKVPRIDRLIRPQKPGGSVSGTVDPSEATASDRVLVIPAWAQDAVFYQIFPERFRNGDPSNDPEGTLPWGSAPPSPSNFFGGDLRGVIDALPYLDSLGVTAIYMNPLFESPSNHKYDAVDYKRIDPSFGTQQELKELLETAHQRRIRIILDGVFNHVSDKHPYFQDAVEWGRESEVWSWFKIQGFPVVQTPKPNYDCWGGHASMPEWNTENPEVRDYLLGVVRYWMDLGIDGWRLDVPVELPHSFWSQLREAVKAMNSRAYMVGEIWGNGGPWLQGDQFDAVMNYRFRDACIGFFANETLDAAAFDDLLGKIRVDTPDPLNRIAYNLLGSHDTARFLTECQSDEKRFRLAVLFQTSYVGAPVIYYGDEVGMTGEKDPGCRGTFPWGVADQNAPLREYYRLLLKTRTEHKALRRGSFQPVLRDGGRYVFLRQSPEEALLVVINRTDVPADFTFPIPRGVAAVKQRDAVDLLTGARHAIRSGEVHVKGIGSMSGAIIQLR
jgi:glycosidase